MISGELRDVDNVKGAVEMVRWWKGLYLEDGPPLSMWLVEAVFEAIYSYVD